MIFDIDQSIETPEPVLLNTWKHHAAVLRMRILAAVETGPDGLQSLARQMVVIGAELMDLYTGDLSPLQIGEQVIAHLHKIGRFGFSEFQTWIHESRGYSVIPLNDSSEWVLRLGDESGRYVHVHPGRWVAHTLRVRANVLKTAVLCLAYAKVHAGDPLDLQVVNRVRTDYLGLAPLGRDLRGDQGIGSIIDVLK